MVDAMTDQIDQDVDRRTERALIAYLRQELSAPATAITGYAEMLMGDAVQAGCAQRIDDLQRILDASRSLHGLILSLLDRGAIHLPDGIADLAEFRRMLRHDLRTPLNAIKGYAESCGRTQQLLGRKRSPAISTSSWGRQLYYLIGSTVW
jgi:adenylate cyclase